MPNPQFNIRLAADLQAWLGRYCAKHGVSKTDVVRTLLEAVRAGHLVLFVTPTEPPKAGSSPEYPIHIAPPINHP